MKNQVLVTGASRGIGLATAAELAKIGWSVTGIARNFDKHSADFMQQIEIDLADLDGLPSKLAALDDVRPDALILNAGVGLFGGLEQLSSYQIRHTIDVNLVSNLLIIKHFLPYMRRRRQGDIIVIGSEAAVSGAKQGAVYCASKFAIRGMTQSLRADCASSNIRVMLVNPGPTATSFFDDLHFCPKQDGDHALVPEDVAKAVTDALLAPRHVVHDEINLQPIKRAFETKGASN